MGRAAAAAHREKLSTEENMKADVVILGAGLAGLVAAIETRAHGADALVLDRLPPPAQWNAVTMLPGGIGNDTYRSGGGGLARFAGDALVEHLLDGPGELDAGRDPVDILIERHMRLGWGEVDAALLRTYCRRVFDDCCWLRDELKMPYDDSGRTVKGLGIGLFRRLYEAAEERGVRMLFEVRARQLLTDASGRVRGVRATRGGETVEIEGGAVILATGGFQGSRELLMEHAGATLTQDVAMVGSPENTGDGMVMAQALGAKTRHLSVCHIRTTDIYFGQGPSRYLMHIYPMGIYFNRRFERFIDEGVADSDTVANAIALQPGASAGLIFDDKARASYPTEFEKYPRREQIIETAETIEALAGKIHVDPQGLRTLVDTFNASIGDGKASGPNLPKTRLAVPIDTPPFHVFHPVRPAMNHTLGGLVVDGNTCQVLKTDGQPIPGFYAAGTLINWAYGKPYEIDGVTTYRGSYHAGASSGAGIALMSGRLAGTCAVQANAAV
jgi:succinate dehydrogenase/fumarate reductase flavoprotein subunit